MAMEFEDFEPIFCEPKVELSAHSSSPVPQFLLHAYASDSSHIVIHATDFHSDTWEAHLSVSRLEDILSHCFARVSIRPRFNKYSEDCPCTSSLNGGRLVSVHGAVQELRIGSIASCSRIKSMTWDSVVAGASNNNQGLTYKDAGVDIDAGSELLRRIAKMAPRIGGFGSLFPLGDSYLVSGTDGVGTKVMLAFQIGIHDSIGIDLVAMSVNDIVTSGAKPLFFLDYFATGHLDVDVAEKVIKGIVDGCQQSDCVLLGGEVLDLVSKGGVKGIAHITGGGFTDNIPRVFPEAL